MGQRLQLVSFLCGAFKKKPSPAKQEEMKLDLTTPSAGGGDATPVPDENPSRSPDHEASDEQQQPRLPPPPGGGGHHMRTASCHHQRSFSGAASKLASSMSMKVLGSAVGRRENHHHHQKEKKFKPEDSVWKKTIILGEKCRVPDEQEDDILYDEKGNRISTYHHRRSHSGKISFSGRPSCFERDGRASCVEPVDLSKN